MSSLLGGDVVTKLHTSITSTIDGGEWSVSHLGLCQTSKRIWMCMWQVGE